VHGEGQMMTCRDTRAARIEPPNSGSVAVSFSSTKHMNKRIDMGFKEGFAAAHNNLDELLAK
jgi:hypothetical protein